MRITRATSLFSLLTCVFMGQAIALPEQCLQAPERSKTCPHLIYKKAKVDVPIVGVKANEMICICLSDMPSLRLEAKGQLEKINQKVALSRLAAKLQLSEENLLSLLRD